jgi:hypothetical protein
MQGCAACLCVMGAIENRYAPPGVIKKILELASVDLNKALTPATIAKLKEYQDQCLVDCGLTDPTSPQYQSMSQGLGVDRPILRFSKFELLVTTQKYFADVLVELADTQASNEELLALSEDPEGARQRATVLKLAKAVGFSIDSDVMQEVMYKRDMDMWVQFIDATLQRPECVDLAETAATLTGYFPFSSTFRRYRSTLFLYAILAARDIIIAQGLMDKRLAEARSWAGLLEYFAELLTVDGATRSGQGLQNREGSIGDAEVSMLTEAENRRTWLGLIKYLRDVLKNTILALGKRFLNVIIIASDLMEVLTSDME